MSPIGFAKGTFYAAGSGGDAALGPLEWNYADGTTLTGGATGDAINITLATNVDTFRRTGDLLGGLSIATVNNVLILSGNLAQFGYAAVQVDEGNTYTLNAADFGVTKTFQISIAGETREYSMRQVGNLLISKQFESYGTPNSSWNGLVSQQQDATQNVGASVSGCNSGTQRLSAGGVASVSIDASNGNYGDPCVGTFKRVFTYYTI